MTVLRHVSPHFYNLERTMGGRENKIKKRMAERSIKIGNVTPFFSQLFKGVGYVKKIVVTASNLYNY